MIVHIQRPFCKSVNLSSWKWLMWHFHSLEFHQTTIKALLSRWRHFETTMFQKGGVWVKSLICNETKTLMSPWRAVQVPVFSAKTSINSKIMSETGITRATQNFCLYRTCSAQVWGGIILDDSDGRNAMSSMTGVVTRLLDGFGVTMPLFFQQFRDDKIWPGVEAERVSGCKV